MSGSRTAGDVAEASVLALLSGDRTPDDHRRLAVLVGALVDRVVAQSDLLSARAGRNPPRPAMPNCLHVLSSDRRRSRTG